MYIIWSNQDNSLVEHFFLVNLYMLKDRGVLLQFGKTCSSIFVSEGRKEVSSNGGPLSDSKKSHYYKIVVK